MAFFDFLSTNIQELISYFSDANKRIYWLYLLSAILFALPIYWLEHKSKSLVGFFRYVFPKKIYTAKSAQHDYYLLIINKLVRAALFPFIILTMAPIALGLSSGMEIIFGQRNFIELSPTHIMIIFTALLFLLDDFTRFILHYLLHRFSILWQFHKVHHSATVLTPFTVYRSHPVESYLYACRMALTQGIAVGIAYYFFGPTLKMIDILGANLFVFIFNCCASNLRHSHIRLSWGDNVEKWFLSPAQHQIHHSELPQHHHSNFGTTFAIWDRMFKCFTLSSQVKNITFGLGDKSPDHSSLIKIYIQPFIHLMHRAKRRTSTQPSEQSSSQSSKRPQ
jgi:sterol desaturase/sphingolipid hydroxylase (fatty acid hydroxylase superfamily)